MDGYWYKFKSISRECIKYELLSKEAVEIEIASYPEKNSYIPGVGLDDSGLSLNVTFDDGSEEIIRKGWVIDVSGLLKGSNTVNAYYQNCVVSLPVVVEKGGQKYVVDYVSESGYLLADSVERTRMFGSKVTEYPIDIQGYVPEQTSYSEEITEFESRIGIVYKRNPKILITNAVVEDISFQKQEGQSEVLDACVKINGSILTKDKDYIIIYENNDRTVNGKVYIIGINQYEGMIEKTLNINEESANEDTKNKIQEANEGESVQEGVETGDNCNMEVYFSLLLMSVLVIGFHFKKSLKR